MAQLRDVQGVLDSADFSNSLTDASADMCQCGLRDQQQYCPLVISSKLDDNWNFSLIVLI